MHAIFAQAADTVPTQPDFWSGVLERHGPLGVVLLALLAAVLLFLRWARPHVDRVVEGHMRLVNKLCDDVPAQRAAVEQQARATLEISRTQESIARSQEATVALLDKHLDEEERSQKLTGEGLERIHERIDVIVNQSRAQEPEPPHALRRR